MPGITFMDMDGNEISYDLTEVDTSDEGIKDLVTDSFKQLRDKKKDN